MPSQLLYIGLYVSFSSSDMTCKGEALPGEASLLAAQHVLALEVCLSIILSTGSPAMPALSLFCHCFVAGLTSQVMEKRQIATSTQSGAVQSYWDVEES